MSTHKKQMFARFLDLKWPDINCDMHLHTTRTDGKADIKDVMHYAVERGLSRIAFTEHVRRDTQWFQEFTRQVRAEQKAYPQLEVLVGCEAKALDTEGLLDATDKILAECDIVLGSVHRFPDGRGGYIGFSSLSQEHFAQIEFELAVGLLGAAPIDVLAHPGGMYFRRYTDFPSAMMREILKQSLERGIAVEINTSYIQNLPGFLRLCVEINPYVSIGSDMHRLEQLGECRDRLHAHGVGFS
ncbi:PHP domain-containing protein [Candidatus Bipolaricaulota bacterium]|nr:PHP domain-containing protein [Candidatus Bipolaricaulota bacterium]